LLVSQHLRTRGALSLRLSHDLVALGLFPVFGVTALGVAGGE
jgi:hypothetical protein